ncbi:MAG: S-layer homology domain-containing protein [Clostridia bacterium]|nr:S-layer homology domain-containing protein [Clostridia bacterium]
MKKYLSLFFAICFTASALQIPALANNENVYYSEPGESIYKYEADAETVIPLELENVPVTENFTFETTIKINSASTSNLKLNLYSKEDDGSAKRLIGINFAEQYMTADNELNNMYGKAAELPYDTGANGNEWAYIMLPGLLNRDEYKNIKIYFDFEKKTYDLYIDNYLAADDNYFTNEEASNLAAAELIAPAGTTDYTLKDTLLKGGFSGLSVKPAKVVNAEGDEVVSLEAGMSYTAYIEALKADGEKLDFTLEADLNGNTEKLPCTLEADGSWHTFSYEFTAEGDSDNITLAGKDEAGNEIIKKSGFYMNPAKKTAPCIFMTGDSTMGPHTGAVGWSSAFPAFVDNGATVKAFGRSGTSTRTYWHSGRTDVMGAQMTEGDYYLFQLGHNDCAAAKTGTGVKNTSVEEYKDYIRKYIRFARQHGVHMVLLTSVTQSKISSSNQLTIDDDKTALYERVAAVREIAEEYNIPLVDVYAASREAFKKIYSFDGNPDRIYVDGTHTNQTGAEYHAYFAARGLSGLDNGIEDYITLPETPDFSKLVALVSANESKDKSFYSAKSFDELTKQINNSRFLMESPLAAEEEVSAQYELLKAAVDGLVEDDPAGSISITASKDAYVQKGAAGTTFNSDTLLAKFPVGDSSTSIVRRTYLGFNIEDIPDEATQVILKVYVTQLGSNATYEDTISVHSVTGNWSENSINWNNMPTSYGAQPLDSFGPMNIFSANPDYDDVKGYKELDVTDYVLAEKAKGTKEVSFAIGATASNSAYCIILSKENSENQPPMLVAKATSLNTIGEKKEEDLNSIAIEDYLNDASAEVVTQDLKELPAFGAVNNYPITWKSSDTSIMSDSGKIVKRPDRNTELTLTALIEQDGLVHSREFKLNVFMDTEGWTDEDYIKYELDELDFSDFSDQNINQVYTDIHLPGKSEHDFCTYTWSVSDADAAKIENGTASFTIKDEEEAELDLTVTAKRNEASVQKVFKIKLIRGFSENLITKLSARISASSGKTGDITGRDFDTYWEANSRDTTNTLTFTFTQPITVNSALFVERGNVIKGFTVSYSRDNSVWKTAYTGTTLGDRNRSLIEFKEFTATAVRFTVTSKSEGPVSLYTAELYSALMSDMQKIEADIAEVTIPKTAASDITLPLTGKNGSTITWKSSHPSFISNTGAVTRGTGESPLVTLTATFKLGDSSKDVPYNVTVPAKSSSGGSGGSSGGGGSTGSKPTVSVGAPQTEKPVLNNKISFKDVPEDFWGYEYIISLAEKKIISTETDNFRPNENITREEFIKLIVLSAGIPMENAPEIKFSDVDSNAWYYPYIAGACAAGIVNGLEDGSFGTGRDITRQDMSVLAERILKLKNKTSDVLNELSYADNHEISDYAKNAVLTLSEMGIMSGYENKFRPMDNATRAEAAKIITMISNINE